MTGTAKKQFPISDTPLVYLKTGHLSLVVTNGMGGLLGCILVVLSSLHGGVDRFVTA